MSCLVSLLNCRLAFKADIDKKGASLICFKTSANLVLFIHFLIFSILYIIVGKEYNIIMLQALLVVKVNILNTCSCS